MAPMQFPYRIIDLTQTLSSNVPTWDGDCGFEAHLQLDYPEGLRTYDYSLKASAGTHIDAPSHFFPDTIQIHELPLQAAPLVLLDLVGVPADHQVSLNDLQRWEQLHGPIPRGACVVAHTGWHSRFHDPVAYRNADSQGLMHFPTFGDVATLLLLQRQIAGIGIDTLSPDGPTSGFPVHKTLLGANKYILENVAHLDQVPAQGAFILALPMKVLNGTESPCRVVALVPSPS
jgi:kynurenine formamidase